MSWLAQLRHVLAKDVSESRWLLLAYGALVVVATLRAAGWTIFSHPALGTITFVVVLAGMFLLAWVVQADSPTRSDAFWATHPLRPSAVAGAKVGYALLLVAIGLAGQAIALLAYGIRGMELIDLLPGSIPAYGAWLLAAMVVAAVVRDLKSVALTIALMPIVFLMVAASLGDNAGYMLAEPPPAGMLAALRVVGVLVGIGMLAWVYRARDSRLPMRVAGFAAAALTLLGMTAGAPERPDGGSAAAERVPLALEVPAGSARVNGVEMLQLALRVRAADLPRNGWLVLDRPEVVARLADGSELSLSPERSHIEIGRLEALTPEVPGVRWLGEPGRSDAHVSFPVNPTPEQWRALARGVTSYVVEGRVVILEALPTATMPLAEGASASMPGQRARIEDLTHEPGEPTVTLRTSTVLGSEMYPDLSPWIWVGSVKCALVNDARGEGLVLGEVGGGFSHGLGPVIPGIRFRTESKRFTPQARRMEIAGREPGSGPSLDAAWFRDARLLLFSEVIRGSYPVRLETEAR